MKGDFTRSTFRPEKHYAAVHMQQGRVQLDADWNEEIDIRDHLDETTRHDVIGACGVPKDGGGFEIGLTAGGGDLTISPGRIYVDGILCELESTPVQVLDVDSDNVEVEALIADGREFETHQWLEISDRSAGAGSTVRVVRITAVDAEDRVLTFEPALDAAEVSDLSAAKAEPVVRRVVTYTTQPDLPHPDLVTDGNASPPSVALSDGTYLAFLDVWKRHLTALDDSEMRETALGGPDTASRTKTVWQLKLRFLQEGSLEDCVAVPDWSDLFAEDGEASDRGPTTGRMSARARPEAESTGPCLLPPEAGYRGLENQLYRIEVHEPGDLGSATFKWSRENGSVVALWTGQTGNRLTVSSTGRDGVLGFAAGNLVELVDDTRELHRRPGELVLLSEPPSNGTLTIDPSATVDRGEFPGNPKVRRWDSSAETTVEVPGTNEGWIPLEDGVEVRFEDGYYNTGDYWLIPARTAEGEVEWPRDGMDRPLARPPDGVVHHYCRLSLVEVHGAVPTLAKDCRDLFPSLTGVCAEDVCFDNTACQLANVDTVQDALEVLCEEHTLRHHKKHLHGWGIVCGLRVICGPDQSDDGRAHVTVRTGYAIDCEGNDILLERDEPLDVLRMIEERQKEEKQPLLREGDGEVCLRLELDQELRPRFAIEPYDPRADDTASLLRGTLLMDFYTECIGKIQKFLQEELTPRDDEKDLPARPGYQRQAILANLLAQVLNPEPGANIYISAREHQIMQDFYSQLRNLLQSETFCAMFDGARSFPDYPESLPDMDTIFGRNNHVRLRLRPGKGVSEEAYTVGPTLNPRKPSTWINRYDLKRRRLVALIDPIAGAKAEGVTDTGAGGVQDVAFSPDGNRIYMIAPTRREENTFFRAGTIGETEVRWGPLATICGVKLVTLATTAADPEHVYAVGVGKGLYRIDPDAVDPNMEPVEAFNASGHLEITADGRAFATSADAADPPAYDQIRAFALGTRRRVEFTEIDLPAEGVDGIALSLRARGAEQDAIYCVVGLDGSGDKRVVAFDLSGTPLPDDKGSPVSIRVEDTAIRLDVFTGTGAVLLTYEDAYTVRMIDVSTNRLVQDYELPVQVGPISIASDARTAYVLNHVSNTITVAPADVLDPSFRFPHQDLAGYRKGILEAFADLLGGFLQYVKDCLCDHFLVDCPECTGSERLFLACISIREGQVYKVCNFSQRRYVKSFPTVGYWLSLVPIMPILDRLVEQFCCMVLPEMFGRYSVGPFDEAQAGKPGGRVRAGRMREGAARGQALDVGMWLREAFGRMSTASRAGLTALARGAPAPPAAGHTEILDRGVEEVEAVLAERGLEVQRALYDPANLPGPVEALAGAFRTPRPGSEVTLYEEGGRVRFYSVSAGVPPRAVETRFRSLARSLEDKDVELRRLRDHIEDVETRQAEAAPEVTTTRVAEMEAEIGSLREQVEELMRSARPRPKRVSRARPKPVSRPRPKRVSRKEPGAKPAPPRKRPRGGSGRRTSR